MIERSFTPPANNEQMSLPNRLENNSRRVNRWDPRGNTP